MFRRAWILWNHSRWIAILAGISVAGVTGEYKWIIFDLFQYSQLGCCHVDHLSVGAIASAQATKELDGFVSDFVGFYNDPIYDEMVLGQWVVWVMSLGSNILATVLIGYKAWSVFLFYFPILLQSQCHTVSTERFSRHTWRVPIVGRKRRQYLYFSSNQPSYTVGYG